MKQLLANRVEILEAEFATKIVCTKQRSMNKLEPLHRKKTLKIELPWISARTKLLETLPSLPYIEGSENQSSLCFRSDYARASVAFLDLHSTRRSIYCVI